MNAIDRYLQELGEALHVRGRARRRLLSECHDHLVDAAADHGDEEAVRRFGPAAVLAASFETEVAAQRSVVATVASLVGVFAIGASTVALLNGADPTSSSVTAWVVVFFACAQTAGVCALLAALRAAAMRRQAVIPADAALLCRRNGAALMFSLATLFAAAAAVPGHASAWAVLAGPAVALVAAPSVIRARRLTRKLDADSHRTARLPLADLRLIANQPGMDSGRHGRSHPIALLVPTCVVAAVAAFGWDHFDHGSISSSFAAAGIEATLAIIGFAALGPVLGLWSTRTLGHSEAAA